MRHLEIRKNKQESRKPMKVQPVQSKSRVVSPNTKRDLSPPIYNVTPNYNTGFNLNFTKESSPFNPAKRQHRSVSANHGPKGSADDDIADPIYLCEDPVETAFNQRKAEGEYSGGKVLSISPRP
jgi:hypothetical protein